MDSNVLVYAERGASVQCRRFLARLAEGEIRVTAPQPVWQEAAHRFMLAEAIEKHLISASRQVRQLSSKPAVVKALGLYQRKILALAHQGLGFEPCSREDLLNQAFKLQAHYGLLTNDSVLLAVALRLRADALATADVGFHGVAEIKVYRPSDLKA